MPERQLEPSGEKKYPHIEKILQAKQAAKDSGIEEAESVMRRLRGEQTKRPFTDLYPLKDEDIFPIFLAYADFYDFDRNNKELLRIFTQSYKKRLMEGPEKEPS